MKVKVWGTRGSTAISSLDKIRYGGNTSCYQIMSACIPEGMWLLVDAGTGIVPASGAFMAQKGNKLALFQTHWHHDHTQGLPLSVFPYVDHVPLEIYGPMEHGYGPAKVYQALMRSPLFPKDLREVKHHMRFFNIHSASSEVFAIHPNGGIKRMEYAEFMVLSKTSRQIPFKGAHYPIQECLVVKLHRTHHPENTISYRFEEGPTGEAAVVLTDHENQSEIPASLCAHINAADLLMLDIQYDDDKYATQTAGWGHGSPKYAALLAQQGNVKKIAGIHHDPWSTDDHVDEIMGTVETYLREAGSKIEVIGCHDYDELEIGASFS